MNYTAPLEFYKHDDVYMASRNVIFAIFQLFDTKAIGTVKG